MGTQPLGKVCAFDSHCSQDMGEAVCCEASCALLQDCPTSSLYLPCTTANDCLQFGGGKVCCDVGVQRFCTKPSGCGGQIIP